MADLVTASFAAWQERVPSLGLCLVQMLIKLDKGATHNLTRVVRLLGYQTNAHVQVTLLADIDLSEFRCPSA